MSIISNLLGHILRIIFKFVNNYGWSIIVFTLFVRLLLVPLMVKQIKSQKAMQDIRPREIFGRLIFRKHNISSVVCPYRNVGLPLCRHERDRVQYASVQHSSLIFLPRPLSERASVFQCRAYFFFLNGIIAGIMA